MYFHASASRLFFQESSNLSWKYMQGGHYPFPVMRDIRMESQG